MPVTGLLPMAATAGTLVNAVNAVAEWQLPADWQVVDFLSDLHLSEDHPQTLAAFVAYLQHSPADLVVVLGDLVEVWVGDDARHQGFEAELTGLLHRAAQQRSLAFLAGNRDFLIGPAMLADSGMRGLNDPTVLSAFGQRLLLSHGDALCLDDQAYLAFRAEVRQPAWQQQFLAQPLDQRRAVARGLRQQSQQAQAGLAPEALAEVDNSAAHHWLRASGCHTLVHGHTHRPGRHLLGGGTQRLVLSDWEMDRPGAPARGDLLRWTRDGLQRLRPDGVVMDTVVPV